MTRIAIDIQNAHDKSIILAVLEAFRLKNMLEFKEVSVDEGDKFSIPQITVSKLNTIIEKAEQGPDIPFEKFLEKHK